MTRTAARELAVRLCFAAQLSGEDTADTLASFFTPEYFETLAEEDPIFSPAIRTSSKWHTFVS